MNNELIEACKTGDIKKLYELIEEGVADIHNDYDYDYALLFGFTKWNLKVVEFLVEKGAKKIKMT